MTVAAVILSASPQGSLADADGQPRVRRIADVAWAGGALPVVVVAADPDGAVAAALAEASVTLAEPAPLEKGPVGQILRGVSVVTAEVSGTDAALVWPARMVWVGPETVTSLIETHGLDRVSLLRPAYHGEAGWPVLLPLAHLDALAAVPPDRTPEDVLAALADAGVPTRLVDLGDPGTSLDADTPRSGLPAYEGPPEPPAAHTHEWGAPVADRSDDAPLSGPALAPYDQAEREA